MAPEDSAPVTPEGQSKRPALNHRASDHSETNVANTSSAGPSSRAKHQKQHRRVGMHGRVPSSNKILHKQHANASSKVNLARRQASPADHEPTLAALTQRPAPAHRRTTSEVRLSRNSSSGNVAKLPAQTSLKRNRSHVEVAKRTKSSEKLKHSSSGTTISQLTKSTKGQVHFDLGSDDRDDDEEEDEWVDASGSNSPYLSRKGSINSSAPSSAKPGGSAASSRPQTPQQADPVRTDPKSAHSAVAPSAVAPSPESPERTLTQHKEYLTSRLLQRSASGAQAVPPKMSADTAEATPKHASPASVDHATPPTTARSHEDGLTSRFVEGPGSGVTNEGSYFNTARGGAQPPPPPPLRADEIPRRSQSVTHFSRPQDYQEASSAPERDNSALIPRTVKRPSAPPEASRTQQKLNLQRASSATQPGPAVIGAGVVGAMGANPLIGVGDTGYDGASSRDPRVGKLLERHGLEYLVVRRYQNPVARSLGRLGRLSSLEDTKRIPRTGNSSTVVSRRSVELPHHHQQLQHQPYQRHIRNASIPEEPAAAQLRRTASARTNGGMSNFEGDEGARMNERLSGSSLVGGEEDDGTAMLLKTLWERPLDLSASAE